MSQSETADESKRHVQRKPDREVMDKAEIYSILDSTNIAHIGFVDPDTHEAVVIPMGYARHDNTLLIHGSTGGRMLMALKSGIQICSTVTLLDGIVIARSAFHSSMNYRSVMAFGVPRVLEGDEKLDGLRDITNGLVPGFWEHARPMTAKEAAQTMVLALELDQVSGKKRTGGVNDDEEDLALPIWAGVLPVRTVVDAPIVDPAAAHIATPGYAVNLTHKP